MAVITITQPPFIVDSESERSTSWPEGSLVWCKDTLKFYQLNSSAWTLMSDSASIHSALATLALVATSGNYNDLSGKPTIPSIAQTTSSLSLSLVGTGATGTQISSTKPADVILNLSASTTSTIGGPSTSAITIKKCATNSATEGSWSTAGVFENDQTITLAIALNSVQVFKGQMLVKIPSGWFIKAESSGSGTHTESIISAEQTIYG